MADNTNGERWFINDGSGTFTLNTNSITNLGASGTVGLIDVADIDGDGDSDFVASGSAGIQLVRSNGLNAPTITSLPAGMNPAFSGVHLTDMDGDGDLDLVTGAGPAGAHVVLENVAGNFTQALPAAPFQARPRLIRSGDFDLDGTMDLIGIPLVGNMTLLTTTSTGSSFTYTDRTGSLPIDPNFQGSVSPGDFDLDGDLDLVLGGGTPRFLRNDTASAGNPLFLDQTNARWGFAITGILTTRASDMDGDGDLDIGLSGATSILSSGETTRIVLNYTRQLVSDPPPTVGGTFTLDTFSGPNYSTAAFTAVLASFAQATPTPFLTSQVEGLVDIDLNGASNLGLQQASSIGLNRRFFPVPNDPTFQGMTVFFQSVIFPSTGGLPVVTNTVRDTVL